jgi:site-specific recombinase XerD
MRRAGSPPPTFAARRIRPGGSRWTHRTCSGGWCGCCGITARRTRISSTDRCSSFFRWLAAEDEIADPMAGLRAPKVADKPVPFFTSGELSKLERACRGNTFAQRRDAAILAVFRATGIRLAELAGIRYHPDDPSWSDVDLQRREIYIRGKRGKDRIVRIDHEAARRVDRNLRVRAGHPQAYRSRLWLGAGDRGPLTRDGIYQMVRRRGEQAGVKVHPHRFRHHFSHTWLDRSGAEGT